MKVLVSKQNEEVQIFSLSQIRIFEVRKNNKLLIFIQNSIYFSFSLDYVSDPLNVGQLFSEQLLLPISVILGGLPNQSHFLLFVLRLVFVSDGIDSLYLILSLHPHIEPWVNIVTKHFFYLSIFIFLLVWCFGIDNHYGLSRLSLNWSQHCHSLLSWIAAQNLLVFELL